jgi:uncharacterized protein YpuA (DUF1002 family)
MRTRRVGAALLGVAAALVVAFAGARAAGEKFVTFGGDLTRAERTELASLFGVDAASGATVTASETVAALQGTGLPAAPTDKSIASSVVTCLNPGDGLTVSTRNVTRITAAVYASALATAGVEDANVVIAAPASNPVTGETALVGVVKSYRQCQAGRDADPARLALAHQQIARTINLAGSRVDLNTASAVLVAAVQPVITGQAKDDAAIGGALDQAAGARGLQLDPAQRTETVAFLKRTGALKYGSYDRGYQVQQASQTEVRVVPAGASAPGQGQPGTAPAPGESAARAESFTGTVKQAGDALIVRPTGTNEAGDRRVTAGQGATITRDGHPASLAEIRADDTVSITANPDGSASRIDASSPAGGTSPWLWLALLLGLVVLGVLAWWLYTRRRDGFVLMPKRAGERPPPQ